MKIIIEADTESVFATKVLVGGVNMAGEINRVVFIHQAGDIPEFALLRTKIDKNTKQPYIDPETGDLAREVIAVAPK